MEGIAIKGPLAEWGLGMTPVVSSYTDDVSLVGKEESLKRALAYWNRAAAQGCHCLTFTQPS